jgi:arylsulfatase A-like enzyme
MQKHPADALTEKTNFTALTPYNSNKMKKRTLTPVLMTLLALAFAFKSACGQSARPNIVFILADDLGWGELGSYGNTFNETPNLDRLASQGVRFTTAYAAAPVCSPTRASLLTGEYPARTGINDFLTPRSVEYLDPQKFTTLNQVLSRAGYHTGIIGKWHLDTHFGHEKGSPARFGFDEVIASETRYIADGDYFFPYGKINTLTTGKEGEYLTDRQSQEAVHFIDRNRSKPFFLYLSYYAVHTRLAAPDSLVRKYIAKFDARYGRGAADSIFGKSPRHEARHTDNPWLAAMLERMDAGVGAVMAELKKDSLADNTILVFFSDNGGAGRVADNGGLRGYKVQLYEGGIREPLIIRWPGKIRPGGTVKVPVCSIDFYPTLIRAAGLKVPAGRHIDGINLVPLLTRGQTPASRSLFWYYPSENAKKKNRMAAAVRQGDYKLIDFFALHRRELYDLHTARG